MSDTTKIQPGQVWKCIKPGVPEEGKLITFIAADHETNWFSAYYDDHPYPFNGQVVGEFFASYVLIGRVPV